MKQTKQIKIFPQSKPTFKSIKVEIDEVSLDPVAKSGLKVGFLSLGLGLIVLSLIWGRLPPEVPLLYSQAYGESQIAPSWYLWLLPGISFVIELISIRAAARLVEEDKLLAQILIWAGALVTVMSLIGIIKIILIMI